MLLVLPALLAAQESAPNKEYSEFLARMDGPVLSDLAKDANARVYRVTFSEALRIDGPVMVRIQVNSDGTSAVYTKWLKEQNTLPTKTLQAKTRTASASETQKLISAFEKAGFWERKQEPLIPVFDGSSWRVDAVKGGEYQVIEKVSPGASDWLRKLSKKMLRMGRSPIWPRE
jgi:hypothetical protein